MKKKPFYLIYIAVFAVLLLLDRFLKNYVAANMQIGDAIPSKEAFVSIRYTINTGVSFSLFSGFPDILIIVQGVLFIAVTAAFIVTYRRLWHPVLQTGLVWIISGGAGNLIDRIMNGYVIDYISVGSFPVWNLADMCIVGGCILIGIYLLVLHDKRADGDERDSC